MSQVVHMLESEEYPIPLEESPFFNYLRTLSPIKPVKVAAHVAQGFPELNIPTPPPIFTSPRLNSQSESVFWKRKQVTPRVPCKSTLQSNSANLADPTDSCSNQVDNALGALQSGCIRSKETTVKVDDDSFKITKYMEIGSDVPITFFELIEENLQGMSPTVLEPGKMNGKSQSLEYQYFLSEKINDINLLGSSLKPASGEQNVLHLETQSAEGGQEGNKNNNTQVIPGKSQTSEHAGVLSQLIVMKSFSPFFLYFPIIMSTGFV